MSMRVMMLDGHRVCVGLCVRCLLGCSNLILPKRTFVRMCRISPDLHRVEQRVAKGKELKGFPRL